MTSRFLYGVVKDKLLHVAKQIKKPQKDRDSVLTVAGDAVRRECARCRLRKEKLYYETDLSCFEVHLSKGSSSRTTYFFFGGGQTIQKKYTRVVHSVCATVSRNNQGRFHKTEVKNVFTKKKIIPLKNDVGIRLIFFFGKRHCLIDGWLQAVPF